MRALEFICSTPWLITEESLLQIAAIAERKNELELADIETLTSRRGQPLSGARNVQMREGVAIVPVVGPIFRYANLFTEISGATSTEILARDLRTALDDPSVRAIILNLDTPGGMANGINELGDMVYDAREEKPIFAYASGQMASAGYWIGSGAREIIADRTAIIGSIGARMSVLDTRGRDARAGVRQIEIVSNQSPDKLVDPTLDEGRAKLQKIVDDLAGVFVSAVARNRDVSEDTVLSDYGRGGQLVGESAVEAGLVDRLGSLESLITELSEPRKRMFIMKTAIAGAANKGPIAVSTTTELRLALENGHTPEEITIKSVDVEKITTEAKAAGKSEGIAERTESAKTEQEAAVKAATDAERARLTGLQNVALKGFDKELGEAIKAGTSVADFAILQAGAAKKRGGTVEDLARGAPKAVMHGGAPPEEGTTPSANGWDKVTAKINARSGRKQQGRL